MIDGDCACVCVRARIESRILLDTYRQRGNENAKEELNKYDQRENERKNIHTHTIANHYQTHREEKKKSLIEFFLKENRLVFRLIV